MLLNAPNNVITQYQEGVWLPFLALLISGLTEVGFWPTILPWTPIDRNKPILYPRLLIREELEELWLSQNATNWKLLFSTTKQSKFWCEEKRRMCKNTSSISIDAKDSPNRRIAVQIPSRTLWLSEKGITILGPEWAWPHSVWEP